MLLDAALFHHRDGSSLIVFGLVVSVVAYFLPVVIATLRGHHNIVGIFLLNLFAGWTLVGWIAALVMATGELKLAPARASSYRIECPDCKAEIDVTDRVCPTCGIRFYRAPKYISG